MSITINGVLIEKRRKGRFFLGLFGAIETILSIFLVVALTANLLFPQSSNAGAGISQKLSYQGRLTDLAGNALGGSSGTNYCLRFSIYDKPSGGTQLWPTAAGTPTTPSTVTTQVKDGVFNTSIGDVASLSFDFTTQKTSYLNVEINANATTCDGAWENLDLRQRIDAVAYARSAEWIYSDLMKVASGSNQITIGSGVAGTASPIYIMLDNKNTAETIGGSCTSGWLWYSSADSKARVCEGGVIRDIVDGILVRDEGVDIGRASVGLDFTGAGVVASKGSNGNAGVININIPFNGVVINGTTISSGNIVFTDANNVSFGLNGSTVTASASYIAGGGGTVEQFSPMLLREATTVTTASLSQLYLIPFQIQGNLSFEQINMIGSASVVPTSAANTITFRMGSASASPQTQGITAGYTIQNQNDIDLFLFSRGAGSFSSEIETFASTRNSFITNYEITYSQSARWTAGNSATRGGASHTISVEISFPALTSGQVIDGASSYTTWDHGYSSWGSTASTSVATATYATNATASVSVASTYPATTAWASNKLIPLMFATSLTPGEYWLGMVRYSGTASSSSSGISTSIAHTATGATVDYRASAMTQTAQITWLGDTNSIASSLAWMGQNTAATIAPALGLGSFSNTWISQNTYLNNAGNPAGAVGFSQINTNVSFFRTWIQFDKKRI